MRVTNLMIGMLFVLAFPVQSWAATYLRCQAADKEEVTYIFSFGEKGKVSLKTEWCISAGRCLGSAWKNVDVAQDSEVDFSGKEQGQEFMFEGRQYFNIYQYELDKVTGLLKINVGIFEDKNGSKFAPVPIRRRMLEEGSMPIPPSEYYRTGRCVRAEKLL